MRADSDVLQRALQGRSRADVLASLLPGRPPLTLREVQQLTRHLDELGEPRLPVRLGILHTYTSELLDPYILFEARLQGFEPEIYHGPYGAIVQEATGNTGLVAHDPELTLLLLRWDDLDPRLGRPLHDLAAAEREALAGATRTRVSDQARLVRQAVGGHIVVTLLPALHGPGLGDHDVNASTSEQAWRAAVKSAIAADLRISVPSTTLLDLDECVAAIGRDRFFDPRLWYTARFPFSPSGAQDLARRLLTVVTVLRRPRAKVIAVDADNTLWGGIVGEDGLDGIALGPDYPGNVYVAFQRRLLDYQQRGFILALCSKNNEADVLQVLREHPHQVLREEHFAALRVNWSPKPDNLASLAEELNLGLDAFVFVDDSAHECLGVRQALPEVEVIQTPPRLLDLPTSLDRIARLETLTLTDEDRRKTEMYGQDRRRRMAASSMDRESYLRSLEMEMSVAIDDRRHVGRIAQLTQKTNQFTLTTRRYTEDDIARLVGADDAVVAHFSLRDVFGDSGIVGVAIVRLPSPGTAELDTFLMSCRVIGRDAETVFLGALVRVLRQRGVKTIVGDYLPTRKNGLVATFLGEHGFRQRPDGRHELAVDDVQGRLAEDRPITVRLSGDVTPVTT